MAPAEQRWGRRVGRALVCSAGTLCPWAPRSQSPAVRPPGRLRQALMAFQRPLSPAVQPPGRLRQALMAFQRSLSKLLILPVWHGREATSSR